jgi:hypothetical protein
MGAEDPANESVGGQEKDDAGRMDKDEIPVRKDPVYELRRRTKVDAVLVALIPAEDTRKHVGKTDLVNADPQTDEACEDRYSGRGSQNFSGSVGPTDLVSTDGRTSHYIVEQTRVG